MWISKIELFNFKSYQYAKFAFPEPRDGRNIVLIGGMNGYGKTSILEALYLCLYGKDAISHLGRAGLKLDNYAPFITKAFNGVARIAGVNKKMFVRVVINCGAAGIFDVHRTWHFKNDGQFSDEETRVAHNSEAPRADGVNGFHLSEVLSQYFVPAHIAPFFFFDGEEVQQLADQSRIEQVKLGLEGLLGVVLLRGLTDRLTSFETQQRKSFNQVNEQRLAQQQQQLSDLDKCHNEIRKEIDQIIQDSRRLKDLRTKLMNRISSAGGGGGNIASLEDSIEKKSKLKQQKRDVQKRLEAILGNQLPFYLVEPSLLKEFKAQLQRELELVQWEGERQSFSPKYDSFKDVFFQANTPSIEPALTKEQIHAIEERIKQAWDSLFYPPPVNVANEIIHAYLQDGLRKEVHDFFQPIEIGKQDVDDLLNQQGHLIIDIDKLSNTINRIKGLDRDGTLAQLRTDLAEVTGQIDDIEQRHRDKGREAQAMEIEINSIKPNYENEKKRQTAASPARKLASKSERVRAAIDEVIPALYALKVEALGQAMTDVYRQLAHKDQVDRITIDNDGTTHILDRNNQEVDFDRSAGENQIFATTIIAGLARVSGVRAPMVVDTPLGRLDSRHRENIFKFWTSDPQRQVILLSQDEEIDADFYARIRERVGATFLLRYEKVEDAENIGNTQICPEQYFDAGAKS